MEDLQPLNVDEDFDCLLSLLPPGWEAEAKELGALRRCRKVPNARLLLRVLLIHLAEGCSLRETAVRAKQGGLLDITDVAIMDRLCSAGEWFRWMSTEMLNQWVALDPPNLVSGKWKIRAVDGTLVQEPGPTGSAWRIHYALDLPSLHCSEVHVTSATGSGSAEGLSHYAVNQDDLFLADRGYARSRDIDHVVSNGGQVLMRFAYHNLPLWADEKQRFDLLEHLRGLSGRRVGDWPVAIKCHDRMTAGRVCAVRRSRQSAAQAQRQACKKAQKNRRQVRADTIEAANYIHVFTTLRRDQLAPTRVLEFYRGRWQIEIIFKRLKSIVGLGHLHKRDSEAARAWIHGKLFVALLIEVALRYAQGFFPWGYPLGSET